MLLQRMRTLVFLLFITSVLLISSSKSTVAEPVGICYGRVGANLSPPSDAVNLIKSNVISRVRLFNPDPSVLNPFSGTGIELTIGVPNEVLPDLTTVPACLDWLQRSIFAHIPSNQLRYLAVGNEVLLKDQFYSPYLVPAMRNLYRALQIFGLSEKIKISSAHAASVLSNSYPPSAGAFDPHFRSVMIPMLQFLEESKSPLMINVYPFFSYINNMAYVPLDYALFGSRAVKFDQNLRYDNMFDSTVDAFVYAMERERFLGIPVVVAETGWPTAGGAAASIQNAFAYNENVVRRSLNNVGTPKRPGVGIEVYLFDLLDENGKAGDDFERHFGIFKPNGGKAYDIQFN